MIISTGVAEIEDIDLAIKTCHKVGNNDITLLKCTSQYPAIIEQANLLTIPDMKSRFGMRVGISDHSMSHIVPVVAVSLGVEVVEKHFIQDRSLGGPDSAFSLEPNEFKKMTQMIRDTEKTLGEVNFEVCEKDKLRRRSLFVVEPIKAGEYISQKNVRSIRPGNGLHPKYLNYILGRTVNRNIEMGTPLNYEDIN